MERPGRIHHGVVVVEGGLPWPEGTAVTVLYRGADDGIPPGPGPRPVASCPFRPPRGADRSRPRPWPSSLMTRMFLPDINLWLALAFGIPYPSRARPSLVRGQAGCALLLLPIDAAGVPATCHEPQGVRRGGRDDGGGLAPVTMHSWPIRIASADEPEGPESIWRGYTQGQVFTPQVWNDAYLAAFTQAGGFELVTFDKGFSRYPGLKGTILS